MTPPLCIGCATLRPGDQEPWLGMPCINCGKPLRHRYGHHFAESFCSEMCEAQVYARRDNRRRRRMRRRYGIACAGCGKVFHPKRRGDAITCSAACRQKIYRERVTDRRMESRSPSADVSRGAR